MESRLVTYLFSAAPIATLRTLQQADEPLSINSIATRTGLSPRGAALVLERLVEAGIVTREDNNNAALHRLALNEKDNELLTTLVHEYERLRLNPNTKPYQKGVRADLFKAKVAEKTNELER